MLFILAGWQGAMAQEKVDTLQTTDSLLMAETGPINVDSIVKAKTPKDWSTWKPNPKRALWLALVIPGGGQIYNRKYWKLPLVYGGFMGCLYAMSWNNSMYKDRAITSFCTSAPPSHLRTQNVIRIFSRNEKISTDVGAT